MNGQLLTFNSHASLKPIPINIILSPCNKYSSVKTSVIFFDRSFVYISNRQIHQLPINKIHVQYGIYPRNLGAAFGSHNLIKPASTISLIILECGVVSMIHFISTSRFPIPSFIRSFEMSELSSSDLSYNKFKYYSQSLHKILISVSLQQ